MKTIKKQMPWLMAGLMIVLLASCGPSYVGVGTGPAYGGYYGPRPYYGPSYGYGYRPYYRPPVVVQRRTYIVPSRPSYNNRPSYAPNARSGYNGGGRRGGGGGYRGPR
ncbi:hypothetical protein [Spirosoma luteolum]